MYSVQQPRTDSGAHEQTPNTPTHRRVGKAIRKGLHMRMMTRMYVTRDRPMQRP
jgi:hypothetical protein